MKLRTRVFLVSFITSTLFMGAAGAVSFLANRDDGGSTTPLRAGLASLEALAARGGAGAEDIMAASTPLRRDLARRELLDEDRRVAAVASAAGFVVAGIAAALVVSAAAAAMVTARWGRLRGRLERLRSGDAAVRFDTGARDEFGMLEAELDRLLEALADRERMRGELRSLQGWGEAAAFMAHQARTPLASLVLSARTVRDALALPDAGAASAAAVRVEGEAERLSALFGRVRALSGFGEPSLATVDPGALLMEAALSLAAAGSGVRPDAITVERAGDGPVPPFDAAYLREAFVNLLSNTADACAERGLAFGARLCVERGRERFVLRYDDAVSGLPVDLAARVGSMRFTTKRNGAGLGVWLVGRIAALHGGALSVGMTPAGGLEFELAFPAGGGGDGPHTGR